MSLQLLVQVERQLEKLGTGRVETPAACARGRLQQQVLEEEAVLRPSPLQAPGHTPGGVTGDADGEEPVSVALVEERWPCSSNRGTRRLVPGSV